MSRLPPPSSDSHRPALTVPATVYAWAATPFTGAPAALFALDATLAAILRTTSQPLVGQMRLTWWHEALTNLGAGTPAQPVLRALAEHGVSPEIAAVVEGWEALLEEPLDAASIALHARRGEALFAALSGRADERILAAGAGWAMADLAAHLTDAKLAKGARDQARTALDVALAPRWSSDRAVGALALDAALALAGRGDAGSPQRALRVLRFRLVGR